MSQDYKILPKWEKQLVERFGLNNAEYKVYQGGAQALDRSGLKIPLPLATNGIQRFKYQPGINSAINHNVNTRNHNDINNPLVNDPPVSSFGTMVMSQLLFEDATITNLDSNGNLVTSSMLSMLPIDVCLFTVNQAKNIVKTTILGRSGTIKEYIADGDYVINMKGIITGSNGVYPKEQVNNLFQFLKLKKNLKITSPYLNDIFGINEIVIESYDMPQTEGGYSYQVFNINALSDYAYEILQYTYTD